MRTEGRTRWSAQGRSAASGRSAARARPTRPGFALIIVMFVAMMLMVSAVALLRVNEDDITRILKDMTRVQATYLAKGALNISLLKAQVFPEALHSAISYRVGRNPFYPHEQGNYAGLTVDVGADDLSGEVLTDPSVFALAGPAFFTGVGDPRTQVDTIPGAPSQDALFGDYDGDGTTEPRMAEYVAMFRSDLCDFNVVNNFQLGPNNLTPQPGIQLSGTNADAIFGIPDPDVFIGGSFYVSDIATFGTGGQQNATSEVLRIVVRARLSSMYQGKPFTEDVNEFTSHRIDRALGP